MPARGLQQPPSFGAPDDYARVRDVLRQADFSEAGVGGALGRPELLALGSRDVPAMLWRTRGGSPLETLTRLFVVGAPADLEAARRAVRPTSVEQWQAAGLVEIDGDEAAAAVKLLPYRNLFLASDKPRHASDEIPRDFVMAVGETTRALADATIRRPCEDALDLGTGCGALAFWAAPHSRRVVAVDCSGRAIGFAEFNARLNGLDNVECVTGNLFEPVPQRQFDLVLMNPPFVISPATQLVFRDTGMRGDEFCRRLVREVPGHLGEGGYFQMICDWAHYAGRDPHESPADWFHGTGCDAWVLHDRDRDLADYATEWLLQMETEGSRRFLERFDEWMDYYRREGIQSIGHGIVTMRRSSGRANWVHVQRGPHELLGPCGEFIVQAFATHDFLRAHPSDAELLQQQVRVSPHVSVDHRYAIESGQWKAVFSQLNLSAGLTRSAKVDSYICRLIRDCDGQRPLGEVLRQLAESVGQPVDTIAPPTLALVRELLVGGVLLPG